MSCFIFKVQPNGGEVGAPAEFFIVVAKDHAGAANLLQECIGPDQAHVSASQLLSGAILTFLEATDGAMFRLEHAERLQEK